MIIHLGNTSPHSSSNLPENSADHTIVPLFGLAPGGVYHATKCCHWRGALLLSAALAVGSHPPGVTWHLVLWSPDFPPQRKHCSDHLTNSASDPNTVANDDYVKLGR